MADGWWNNNGAISGCVLAYNPVGAASLAASYSNLFNPGTYDAAAGVAPTWAYGTGWTFNGTTQYLTTGYAPPNQVAFTAIVRISNLTGSGTRAILATPNTFVSVNLGFMMIATSTPYYLNSGGAFGSAGSTSGVFAIAGNQGYKNSATDGSSFSAAGSTWKTMLVGAYNGATVRDFFPGNIQAMAIYNTTLTLAQVQTLTTAMNALPVAVAKGLPIIEHWHNTMYLR